MALEDIVNVTITTQTTAPTRVGFGTPLVLAYHNVFTERSRVYTSTADMVTDGFATTDGAVRVATALLAQSPKVNQIIVGRMANAMTQDVNFQPAQVIDNTDYTITINGTAFTIDSGVAATPASIMTALHTAINLGAEPVTSTDNTGDIDIAADVAGTLYTYEYDRSLLESKNITVDAGVVADYLAVKDENDDFYSVHLASQSEAEVLALAAQIETEVKLLVISSQDDEILDVAVTTDLFSDLEAASYARTVPIWHHKQHQYAGAAWAGVMLPKDPGSATWKFKTLAGVEVSVLSATEVTNIENKTGNWYVEVAGVSITCNGWSASGEFVDITRGVDWLRARLQERIFARLVNLDKLPFTDPGIQVVEAEIRAQLNDGIDVGLIAASPEFTVTVPLAADVPFADKAARLLQNVTFEATLAGAIHELVIQGVVTV